MDRVSLTRISRQMIKSKNYYLLLILQMIMCRASITKDISIVAVTSII